MPRIPASMNLGLLPTAIPSIMFKEPREGAKSVAYTIAWATAISRNVDTVSINMQDGGALEFSQICGLIVDNSNCGCDLDFIFPDTDVTVSIPAYAPYTCLQINTQQVQFFIRGINCLSTDITAISVLNYAPNPVAVPITVQQQTALAGNVPIDGIGTAILLNNVSGTLRGLAINAAWNGAVANFNNLLRLRDGAGGAILWSGNIAGITTSQFNGPLVTLENISRRFSSGIVLEQSGGFAVGGTLNCNIYYVTP